MKIIRVLRASLMTVAFAALAVMFEIPRAIAMDCPQNYYARWSNGVPANSNYFPIAVWLQSPYNAQGYKNAGINLFIGLWDGPTVSQLSSLTSVGMKTICDQNACGLSNVANKTIVSWMHDDEPDNAQSLPTGGYGPPVDPSVIIQKYNTFKSKDASRPVLLNLGQGVAWDGWYGRGVRTGHPEDYYEYVKGCDIPSFDIYPVNSSDSAVSGNLWYVPQGIDRLRKYTGDLKPVWCWIETTKISADSAAKPTPDQVKSEVWMALVHGANGIGYFCHSWTPSFDEAALLHDTTMLAAVKAINLQIQSLAPVLNSPTVSNLVSVVSSNSAVPIDMMVKRFGGATYIFAVGMRGQKTTGTFKLPAGGTVEVVGENRQIVAGNGTMRDDFSSYGVHIYKFTPADASGNGMFDSWEMKYFGSTTDSRGAPDADWDGDGYSNFAEYTAGTDPTNRNSCLEVNICISNGQVIVTVPAVQAGTNYYLGLSRLYSIEKATNLTSGGWAGVPQYTNVAGADRQIVLTNQPSSLQTFYRAMVWLR